MYSKKPNNENILQVAYAVVGFQSKNIKTMFDSSITPYSHLVVHQVCMLLRNVPGSDITNAMQVLAVKSDDQSQADLQTR